MLGNQVLDCVSIERDLGILIQDKLKLSEQCTKVVKTCHRILGMIKRSFTFISGDVIVTLYKSFIRPQLCSSMEASLK